MLLLLTTPALALDCTGLDPDVCGDVNAIAALIEGVWGAPVVADDAPQARLRTTKLYDDLLALQEDLDTYGCTVDGIVGGRYLDRVSFTGQWAEDGGDSGPHSGALYNGSFGKSFTGSYSGSRTGSAGDVYGHFKNRQFVGNRDSDGFFAGGFQPVQGRKGVYYGFSGTCTGDVPRTLDFWYNGTLWPYYPMRMFASTPWNNPLTGVGTMDAQCQADWDALGDGTPAVFKAGVTNIPAGIVNPAQRFRNGPELVLAGSETFVAADVESWFDTTQDVAVPLDVEADGSTFAWTDGTAQAIAWWGYFDALDPGSSFGDCDGWTSTSGSGAVGGIPLTDDRRLLAYFVSCANLVNPATLSRTICIEDTDPTD